MQGNGYPRAPLYRSGNNLPVDAGRESWRYRGRLLLNQQSLAALPLDVAATIAELRVNGVFLARFSSPILLSQNTIAPQRKAGEQPKLSEV